MSTGDSDQPSSNPEFAATEQVTMATRQDSIVSKATGSLVLPAAGYQLGELIGRGGMARW